MKKLEHSPKISYIFVFSSYRKNFVGDKKWFRNSNGKRAIDVLVIEV